MTSISRLVLLVLFIFFCFDSSGQWLNKGKSSDDLQTQAKKEIELGNKAEARITAHQHYVKAISLLNEAVDISPRNLDIYLLLGKALSLAGKEDSARIQLNYVIQKNPKYRDAYIYLINIETVACNYGQALEYADLGLKQFPSDRDILLKKLDIYNKQGEWLEGDKLAEYLFDRYSSDALIRKVYIDYKLTLARQYAHRGELQVSRRAYDAVLEQDPLNQEALQAVYSVDVRSGNYESSLAYTNRALQTNPQSQEFLLKKISILDAMSRYAEAIEVVRQLLVIDPREEKYKKLNIYLRMEAGRYYTNMDPYLLYQSVLEKEPKNKDALNYVINIAYSRGLLNDALQWENLALKSYPNDYEIYLKKMGTLEALKYYGKAADMAEVVYGREKTDAHRQNMQDLRILSAKQYINDQEYDSAIVALNKALGYDRANIAAINYLINAYVAERRYDEAIHEIDQALTIYQGDEKLLFKKAGVLESYQKYDSAAAISKQLLKMNPESRQYLIGFVEQSLEASKQSMQYDDYYGTIRILEDVLEQQPQNVDALNYIINIEDANKQFDSAIYYVNQALRYYPDNRDFQLKKSSIYEDARQYREAYAISGQLHSNYPYNLKYRNAYMNQLIGSGRQYMSNDVMDSALIEFYKALDLAPNDTTPLFYVINVTSTPGSQQDYDTALALIQRGRMLYPDNPFFLNKRAIIYEAQQQWYDAWLTADTLAKLMPYNTKYQDYAKYLFSRRLKNEIGLFYLHSTYIDSDNVKKVNSIATLQYSRSWKRGVITGRINYAGRVIGTGYQFELETFYRHRPKTYSYAVAAYSPNGAIFPTYRLGYSLFHNFGRGWEAELGARYLKADSGTIYSGVGSISKEVNDFYFNLRGYYIDLIRPGVATSGDILGVVPKGSTYYSAILTSRYYLRERKDYFTTIMGYGTAPDDFSQNYQISQVLAFKTVSVGAGYTHLIDYRTTMGIFGSWYNRKIAAPSDFQNQYDVYVTLLRRF